MNDKERITFAVLGTLIKYGSAKYELDKIQKPALLTLISVKFFSFSAKELREVTQDIIQAEQRISIMLKELDVDIQESNKK